MNKFGPLWQLTENAKGKRQLAQQAREEAASLIERANRRDAEAVEYEEAARILKEAKDGK
jgi:hypothetical protein